MSVLLAVGVFAATTRAELEWTTRRVVLEPAAGASEAAGLFEFVNRGTSAVRIADVKSGCGCTVAALEQEVVPPGGKGRVRATFHIGDREGRQAVAVTVTAHEPEVRAYELTLEVAIKEFVTVTPRLLYWRVGDEVAGKIFRLSLASGFRFVGVESTSQDFATEVVTQAEDAVQVKVTPRDLWAKRNGSIRVKVAQPGQAPVEVVAMVRVL